MVQALRLRTWAVLGVLWPQLLLFTCLGAPDRAPAWKTHGSQRYSAAANGQHVEVTPQGWTIREVGHRKLVELQFTRLTREQGSSIEWLGGSPVLHGDTLDLATRDLTVQHVVSAEGVRQNFLLSRRPAGSGALRLEIAVHSDLPVRCEGDQAMVLSDREGRPLLRYADLRCWDADGRPLQARMELRMQDDARLTLVVDDANARYPVVIDPISTVPNTTLNGPVAGSEFGYPPAPAGDLNGDGYSDLVSGARLASNPETEEGMAYVYYGGPTGIPTTPSVTLQLNIPSTQFGSSVSTAGDVNGDGYSDLIIGAQTWENDPSTPAEGGAFIYFGSPTGISTIADQVLQSNHAGDLFGANVACAGDINNDGYSDVIVGGYLAEYPLYQEGAVWIFMGSATGLNTTALHRLEANINAAHFGRAIGPAGDVNADGFSDIIIGAHDAPNVNADAGKAWIYHGSAVGLGAGMNPAPATTLVGPTLLNASFGWSVTTAGDVNGDGYSDVAVGAYLDANGQANEGSVWVFHGSATGVSTTAAAYFESNVANTWMGRCVATAGDINDDGYADLLIGLPLFTNGQSQEGVVRLHLGSATGVSATSFLQWEINLAGANFGDGMGCVGDVNGDGFSDIAIGARLAGASNGTVAVFHGGPYSVSTAFTMSRFGDQANAALGRTVANAGDVNGDGYADIVVGAPGMNTTYVHYGSPSGISSAPSLTLAGAPGSGFGTAVASAGDVNGDGYADVVIGAPTAASAFVHMGGAGGLSSTAAATLTGGTGFGTAVAPAGDVNTDGHADVIVGAPGAGAVSIFHGTALGLATTPAIVLTYAPVSAEYGCSVNTAGDVNGDGYSDVIIGARAASNGQSAEGLAFVHLGSTTGISATVHRQLEVNQVGAGFGTSVAGVGDVNGDGFFEVAVGAYLWESTAAEVDEGAAFIFNGSAAGTLSAPASTLQRNIASGTMGASVAEAGDVNGDGYADVIIGAPLSEVGEANEGMSYVYLGSPTGVAVATPDVLQPNIAGQQYGSSVSGGGDLDGDGYSDVVIGAPNAAPALAAQGGVYWHRGNRGRSLGRLSRQYDADLVSPLSTNSMDFASPNFFGIGHRARSSIHRCRTRLRWQVVYQGQPFTGNPITNSLQSTGTGATWTVLPTTGTEIKQLVLKVPGALRYKWRVRVEYDMAKMITGQRFGRWFYGYANAVGDIGILPIELLSFTGRPEGEVNVLEWTTASEQNSSRFAVMRSTDAVRFEAIGQVQASGWSSGLLDYGFVDHDPPQQAYYRLDLVDADGHSEPSSVIAVFRDAGELRLWPVPADGELMIAIEEGRTGGELIVQDAFGRIVLTSPAGERAGSHAIDISKLAPGHYTLTLMDARGELAGRSSFIRR
ncbi:MAG: FG-GAP repeat protein [Flavobacteriales bacterium]|nr:FG-GAP repeat protein [Flavobacteriales bacterium]